MSTVKTIASLKPRPDSNVDTSSTWESTNTTLRPMLASPLPPSPSPQRGEGSKVPLSYSYWYAGNTPVLVLKSTTDCMLSSTSSRLPARENSMFETVEDNCSKLSPKNRSTDSMNGRCKSTSSIEPARVCVGACPSSRHSFGSMRKYSLVTGLNLRLGSEASTLTISDGNCVT